MWYAKNLTEKPSGVQFMIVFSFYRFDFLGSFVFEEKNVCKLSIFSLSGRHFEMNNKHTYIVNSAVKTSICTEHEMQSAFLLFL